jgi:hypothetical protein
MNISQDYFDETCRENADAFDLAEQAAVQETIDQLTASMATVAGAGESSDGSSSQALQHLLLSHPDSPVGQEQRRERAAFVQALECVRTMAEKCESESDIQDRYAALQLVDDKVSDKVLHEMIDAALPAVEDTTDSDNADTTPLDAMFYRQVFQTEQGWTAYMSALQSLVEQVLSRDAADLDHDLLALVFVLIQTLTRLVTLTSVSTNNGSKTSAKQSMWQHRRSLQQIMPSHMVIWLQLYQVILGDVVKKDSTAPQRLQLLQNLLVLGHCAIQQCERNKQIWTRLQLPDQEEEEGEGYGDGNGASSRNIRSLLELLLDTVDGVHEHLSACTAASTAASEEWYTVARTVGRFLTSLGTFEESSALPAPATSDGAPEQGTPVVASAHATVLAMSELGAVHKLLALCRDCPNEPAVVTTLRCMAIHDSIVQTMVAGGVLEIVRACFVNNNDGDGDKNDDNDQDAKETENVGTTVAVKQWALRTAVIGLVRNLCANDEIKSTLCGGRQSVVQELIAIMNSTFRDKTGVSHALLLEHACGTIAAMALRISRNATYLVKLGAADEIVRAMNKYPDKATLQRQAALAIRNIVSRATELCPAVLQAGAQVALTTIAARHQGCQDEVYAALRDLGVPVTMRVAEQDDVTGKMVLRQREMFGERTPHFRAVFDKS